MSLISPLVLLFYSVTIPFIKLIRPIKNFIYSTFLIFCNKIINSII